MGVSDRMGLKVPPGAGEAANILFLNLGGDYTGVLTL